MKGFTTRAIHSATSFKDTHNALRPPLYDSVSFEFDSSEDIEAAFTGHRMAHSYSRISNPTVAEFEFKIKELTDAIGTIAVASGMAAISNTFMTLCKSGDSVMISPYLFGNTISLLERTLAPWGLNVQYADFSDIDKVEKTIDDSTRIIFLETITNPQLAVVDFDAITSLAAKHGITSIVDNTVTTPCLFNSKEHHFDIEIISTTKYISGGATSVGGIIIDNGLFNWKKSPKLAEAAIKFGPFAFLTTLRREVYRNLGASMAPHNAWLQILGLETTALRLERSCSNAMQIAGMLQDHKKIQSVNYPGLPGSKYHNLANRYFKGHYGGLLTFDLENKAACYAFMDALHIIRRATNLNDNKTLVIHPASTIFSEFSKEEQQKLGVRNNTIRLSAGIEDIEDLLDELNLTLEAL